MSKREEQNWLLLTVKSLSHSKDSKHYQLLIKNHAIDNQLTIQNQFTHNYEYVYKLWPCRPAERELIKIDMFEVLKEKGKNIFVKRGQASPLVHYSSQGEKFQFYASSQEKSVLILKFRTENEEKIENEASKDRLNIINQNMSKDLQSNRYESQGYAKYLDYTNQVIDDLSKGNIEKQKISIKPRSQQGQKDMPSRPISQAQSALTKQLNTSSNDFKNRDKRMKADKFLNNSKYLNKDIELPSKSQMNERSHRQCNRAKTEAGSSLNGLEESIRKRRQLYLCNRVETIAQKPSQSPILTAYRSEEEEPMKIFTSEKPQLQKYTIENETQTDRLEVRRIQKERVKSECFSTPDSYKPGIIRMDSQLSKISNQSSKKGENKVQKKKKEDQIVRTSNFPIENANYLSLSRRFGTIRRKKLESLYSSPDLLEENALPSRERSITHVSRSSKIYPAQKDRYFDLEIFSFRATLYRPKGRCFRKLVLVFEESRYATESVQCLHLTAGWNQKFGIRNCREQSYLYCRLYCSCQDEQVQEGEATVNLREVIQSKQKVFKVLFISQELAIGYLQFQLSKTDCTSLVSRGDLGDSKDGSLPKIKKDSLPRGIKGISAKKTSLPLQMRKSIQSNSSPKEIAASRSKSRRRLLRLREVDQTLAGGERSVTRAMKPEPSGMSKIREKKLKMRSKLK